MAFNQLVYIVLENVIRNLLHFFDNGGISKKVKLGIELILGGIINIMKKNGMFLVKKIFRFQGDRYLWRIGSGDVLFYFVGSMIYRFLSPNNDINGIWLNCKKFTVINNKIEFKYIMRNYKLDKSDNFDKIWEEFKKKKIGLVLLKNIDNSGELDKLDFGAQLARDLNASITALKNIKEEIKIKKNTE